MLQIHRLRPIAAAISAIRPVKYLQFGAVLSGLMFSAAAIAANTATDSTADSATDTLPEVGVSATAVKDVVVDGYQAKKSTTATKTEKALIDVPQSISVATQELMKDQAVQNLGDVVRYVPGVAQSQGEGNRETFLFRGQSTTGDFFVDGVRDDTQYYRDLYNIERVEVLKGPNGMIFGRGGAGGVINRVTKEAGWRPIRELSLQYGSFDQRRATVDINQAINEVAAFRINAMVEDSNSYRDGVDLQRQGINPTVTLMPSEQTKIVLSAEYFNDDRVADRGIPSNSSVAVLNGRPAHTNESTFFGNAHKSPTGTEVQSYSALIEHAFDNGVTLRNRTRYADYDKFYQNVYASGGVQPNGNVALGAYRNDTERQNFFNQTDVLYRWQTGALTHDLLAGVEIGRQHTTNLRKDGVFPSGNTVSLADPTFRGPVLFQQTATTSFNTSTADIAAVYLQDQVTFNPQWQAIIGLRYDSFKLDLHDKRPATAASDRYLESNDDLLSPRAGLIYKPMENIAVYTSYSQSYVPRGGDQLGSLNVNNDNLDPEKFINKEIGVKWDVNPAFSVTAAIYKLERNKISIVNPADPTTSVLADGQETKGFELGLSGRITDKWSVAGGYAYQDAEFTKAQGNANPANVILAGTRVANVPKQTFSLWNRYDFNATWGAALGVISRSDMDAATATVSSNVVLPGYTRFDAAVYAKLDEKTRLQLNLENITNKEYILYANNNNNITPGSPTAARVTLIYNF